MRDARALRISGVLPRRVNSRLKLRVTANTQSVRANPTSESQSASGESQVGAMKRCVCEA